MSGAMLDSARDTASVNRRSGSLSAMFAVLLVSLACGEGSPPTPSSSPLSPADQLRANAAQEYEKLDSVYFDASQAAVQAGKKTGGEAGYAQTMNGLADANHAFFQGLVEITFPAEDGADVDTLKQVTVKIETETLLEVKNVGSTTIVSDFDVRNAADRKLRKDLGLDPSEVPS